MKFLNWTQKKAKHRGRGVIEYAGAMIVAAMIVVMLTTGIQENNWMYNAYDSIFNAAGSLLTNAIGTL